MTRLTREEVGRRLFREKRLTDVYKTYNWCFPQPTLGRQGSLWTLLAVSLLGFALYQSSPDVKILQSYLTDLVTIALTLVSAFFGIAIAGFAIFASGLRAKTIDHMIEKNQSESPEVPVINYLFAIFAYTLSALFFVFVTVLFYQIFLSANSPLISMNHNLTLPQGAQRFTLIAFTCFFIAQMTFVLLIIKSFIWNLHQILLVLAATTYTDNEVTHPSSAPK